MGNWKTDPVSEQIEQFPLENFEHKRKAYTPTQAVIPYKPVEDPAWVKHQRALPPKPARFQKLHDWDKKAATMATVCRWAIVVAGAATVAAPVVISITH